MKIRWAAKQLEKGKRVRRACWSPIFYVYENKHTGNLFLGGSASGELEPYKFSIYNLLADDWELYEGDSDED
jgi:hypothetical protein